MAQRDQSTELNMALSIGTNNSALQAAAAASSVNRNMETSMERLSTGKRINSASDDAAGVAISSRLSSEVRGTNQSVRNALDAQALIDTAEGAHKEVENILQRMRELAIQAANGTNNTDDITNLEAEFTAMSKEISRIGASTSFAGKALTDEDGKTFSFQVGSATGTQNQITVTINSIMSEHIGGPPADLQTITLIEAAGLDDLTETNAAIDAIDLAIKEVNTQRSELGAVSNRLNHTVNNLTNMSTNLSSAQGRIQDADFALETTELAKNQILQQASTAMLAQANASKQNVLGLLQS
jgi:flagellin